MRKIKFRAWIAEEKFMAIQGSSDLETLKSFMHHYSAQPLLMQYSGFKDKNRIEIYEDDILEVSEPMQVDGTLNKKTSILPTGKRYRVKFLEGAFVICKSSRSPRKRLTSALIRANGMIVVGNVYGNEII